MKRSVNNSPSPSITGTVWCYLFCREMHSCLDKWFSKRVKKCQFPKSAHICLKTLKPTPPNFYIYHDAVQRVHVHFDLGFINESNFLRVIFLHNPWLSRYDTCYAKDCFVIMPLIVPKRSLWTRTVLYLREACIGGKRVNKIKMRPRLIFVKMTHWVTKVHCSKIWVSL